VAASPAAVALSPTASQKKLLVLDGGGNFGGVLAPVHTLTVFNLMLTTRFSGCMKPSFPAASEKGQR
jgi:hypothetical protein